MDIFAKITRKTMKANKARTIVTIIGVILATSMVTAVVTFGTSIQNYMYEYAVQTDGKWHVAAKGVSEQQVEQYADDKEVKNAAVLSEIGYASLDAQKENIFNRYLYIQSIDKNAADMLEVTLQKGRMPENEHEIVLSYELEEENGKTKGIGDQIELSIGDRLLDGKPLLFNTIIRYQNLENGNVELLETFQERMRQTYTIVGILEHWGNTQQNGAGSDAFIGKSTKTQPLNNVYIELKKPKNAFSWIEKQDKDVYMEANTSVLKWLGVSGNASFQGMLSGMLSILITIIGVGAISLIYNAFSISLRERTTQFGLLSSIGATKKQLRRAMWYEALHVAVIGIPLGILSGLAGIGITLQFIGDSLAQWIHGNLNRTIQLKTSPGALLFAAATAFLIICISVWIPCVRIQNITPIEAIRANKDIRIRKKEIKSPAIIRKIWGLEGVLADKNYKRDRKKYRTTVFSLTISIVLFTSATLFSDYMSKTGSFMLEAPEYELTYQIQEKEEGKSTLKALLENGKNVTDVKEYGVFSFPVAVEQKNVTDDAINVLGDNAITSYYHMSSEERKTYGKDNRKFFSVRGIVLPDEEFRKLAKEEGVDADSYFEKDSTDVLYYDTYRYYDSERKKYREIRTLDNGKEEDVTVWLMPESNIFEEKEQVESVQSLVSRRKELTLHQRMRRLPDYEQISGEQNPNFCIIFFPESKKEQFLSGLEEDLTYSYKIKSSEYQTSYEDLCDRLEKETSEGMLPDRLQNLGQRYDQDRGIMIAIRVLSYGFIILISLIAAANVFNTISTNIMLRKREFAMLKSMGMGRKSMQKMMNYECMIYGIRSIVYGIVLSLGISFAMYSVLMTGAEIEYGTPWKGIGIAVIWVFVVVFATMLYSMGKIRKQSVIEELKRIE